ncbi:MAG: hypothetical protein LLG44_05270 [Chloroflexi bacterium]|nr:hypothetical protein [Chloroflexota bacterium]
MSLEIIRDARAYCSQVRQFTYELAWRPERHLVAGTQFELRSHCLRAFHSWRFVWMEVDGADVTFRWKIDPSPAEMWANRAHVLLRAKLPYGARRGQPIILRLRAIPPIWAGVDTTLSVWTLDLPNAFEPASPAPEAGCEGSACTLTVAAGAVERVSVYSSPMPGANGRVRTLLVPEDRFGNPSRLQQPAACRLSWGGRSREVTLQGSVTVQLTAPLATARAVLSIPQDALAPGENIANAQSAGANLLVTGNPVWPVPSDGLRAAFGEFHWHTEFSADGQRSITQALAAARDDLNLDFAAPGDHNPTAEQWQATTAALEDANQPDEFATFFGWENGTDRGHENYYFSVANHPLVCGGSADITGGRPDTLTERLRGLYASNNFLAVPHHTNAVAETRRIEDDTPYWYPYPWGAPEPYIRLAEIMQCRGNQEREEYDDAWRGWHQHNQASIQQALALGHHIGFSGGTDNHCGYPGRAWAEEGLGLHSPKSVILTGAWVPHLERHAVLDALAARHTWAVWDTRALVQFSINGALAGDELIVRPGAALNAQLRLSAEDSLQAVELVSEGTIIWSASYSQMDIELEIPLAPAKNSTYIYLRALQRNGGIIYASPVFITVK